MIRRLVRYIKGLEVTQGAGLGDPLRLYPWERRFIRGAFDPDASTAGLSVEPVADPRLSARKRLLKCGGTPSWQCGSAIHASTNRIVDPLETALGRFESDRRVAP